RFGIRKTDPTTRTSTEAIRRVVARKSWQGYLAAGEKRRKREVAHRVETGRRGEHLRDRIDDDRRGGDIAMDPARHLHRQVRRPFDIDRVVRLGRSEVRLHVQLDNRFAFAIADTVLDDAADIP